jgi:hypothetical protein
MDDVTALLADFPSVKRSRTARLLAETICELQVIALNRNEPSRIRIQASKAVGDSLLQLASLHSFTGDGDPAAGVQGRHRPGGVARSKLDPVRAERRAIADREWDQMLNS